MPTVRTGLRLVAHKATDVVVESIRWGLTLLKINPRVPIRWIDGRDTHDLAYWLGHFVTIGLAVVGLWELVTYAGELIHD